MEMKKRKLQRLNNIKQKLQRPNHIKNVRIKNLYYTSKFEGTNWKFNNVFTKETYILT